MQENQGKLWWLDEKTARIFNAHIQKHIMSLNIAYLLEGIPKVCWVSGFLVFTKGLLIWMTAGHVLKTLDELLQNNKVSGIKTRWIDNCLIDAAQSITFDYTSIRKFSIDIDGYDFGIVILQKFYADQILKIKENVPLTEAHWRLDNGFKPKGYYLVGIPEEFTEFKQISASTELYVKSSGTLVSVPLTKEDPIIHQSEDDFWQHENNFYGKIHPIKDDKGNLLTNISGMSGGPIVGVCKIDENKYDYRIIALQSGWLQRKFTRGTRFDTIIEPLNNAIQKVVSANQG